MPAITGAEHPGNYLRENTCDLTGILSEFFHSI